MSFIKWFCCRDIFGETEKGPDSIIPVKKRVRNVKKFDNAGIVYNDLKNSIEKNERWTPAI